MRAGQWAWPQVTIRQQAGSYRRQKGKKQGTAAGLGLSEIIIE
jgi:hypothetical protein